MKILIVTPSFGGIDLYSRFLSEKLSQFFFIDIFSIPKEYWPYSTETKEFINDFRFVDYVRQKIKTMNDEYDFIFYNFGKNDMEQSFLLFHKKFKKSMKVYFVHNLSWNLFSELLINKTYYNTVLNEINNMDYYILFSSFAVKYFPGKKKCVALLPSTHENYISLKEHEKLKPYCLMIGYDANYKHPDKLELINARNRKIIIAGRGFRKKVNNLKNIILIDKELNQDEFSSLIINCDIGLMPYKNIKEGELFQGSGVLPNYLFWNKPVLLTDIPQFMDYKNINLVNYVDFDGNHIIDTTNIKKTEIKKNEDFSFKSHFDKIVYSLKLFKKER